MRKLLLSAITLFLFSISISLFQLSCSKDTVAKTNEVTLDRFAYVKVVYPEGPTLIEVWTAKFDGTDQQKVNINVPDNSYISDVRFTPDGEKLIMRIRFSDSNNYWDGIYTCNIDGSNFKKIIGDNEVFVTYHI